MATFTVRVFADQCYYADLEVEAESFEDACSQIDENRDWVIDADWEWNGEKFDQVRVDWLTSEDGRELSAGACWIIASGEGMEEFFAEAAALDAEAAQ